MEAWGSQKAAGGGGRGAAIVVTSVMYMYVLYLAILSDGDLK